MFALDRGPALWTQHSYFFTWLNNSIYGEERGQHSIEQREITKKVLKGFIETRVAWRKFEPVLCISVEDICNKLFHRDI